MKKRLGQLLIAMAIILGIVTLAVDITNTAALGTSLMVFIGGLLVSYL